MKTLSSDSDFGQVWQYRTQIWTESITVLATAMHDLVKLSYLSMQLIELSHA